MDNDAALFQKLQDEYIHYENMAAKIRQAPTVIKNIFNYLNLPNLKNCRYVCQNWNAIAEPLLRQRSKIVFNNNLGRTHSEFSETFRDAKSNLKFTSFKFSMGNWRSSTLEDFIQWQIREGTLEELDLDNIILKDRNNFKIENPLINDWIYELPLKKLKISGEYVHDTDCVLNISLDLDTLSSVKELVLNTCKVNVREGNRISPTKITLQHVLFFKNGNCLSEFSINDIVEFKETESIKIMNFLYDQDNHKAIVNLAKCKKLKYLKLTSVEVAEWSPSKCNIHEVELYGISLCQNNSMTMKNLKFDGPVIDFSFLSPELESFTQMTHYNEGPNMEITCSRPINLPNLKSLLLCGRLVQEMRHFNNCPNLIDMTVLQESYFNLGWLPRSIRQLKLSDVSTIEGHKGEAFDIDFLILDSYSFSAAKNILQKIKPKVLSLRWLIHPEFETNDTVLSFLNKFQDLKKVFVGPFYFFQDHQFTNSAISQHVNRKAKFYLFENQKGTAISEFDFNHLNMGRVLWTVGLKNAEKAHSSIRSCIDQNN